MFCVVFFKQETAYEIVVSDRHVVAVGEAFFGFFVLIESGAGKADDDDHHTEVNDVAAVTTRVAVGELDHGGEHALSSVTGNDFAATVILTRDGQGDEHTETDRH